MRTSLINTTGGVIGAPVRFVGLGAVVCGLLAAGGPVGVGPVAFGPSVASAKTVTLSNGHVDAVAARISGGRLRFVVKDDTGSRVRWRDPKSVVIRVGSNARYRLPSGRALSFIGRPGQTVWLIPQTQKRGVVWAGWNTEQVSSRQLRGPVGWRLDRVRGPGRVAIYQTGSFGRPSVLFNSAQRTPQSRTIPLGVHAHGNWAFTARGTYRMTFTLSATSRSGKRLSDTRTLTLRVG
ncbi:MAG: TIGR03773 family transporter-associated surface protein [Patulibacter sp.]|nr:TIGR03773 family transporter-associated surface protein [Patulibacter sp.]